MQHVMTATAYERKDGGFRGVVLDKRRTEKVRSDSPICTSLSEARSWAKARVFEMMGDTPWAPGYAYKPDWTMNVFTK